MFSDLVILMLLSSRNQVFFFGGVGRGLEEAQGIKYRSTANSDPMMIVLWAERTLKMQTKDK